MPGLTFFFFVLEYTTNRRATLDHQVVSCQLSVVSSRPNTSKTRRTSQWGTMGCFSSLFTAPLYAVPQILRSGYPM